jgi:hypothetical protein
MALSIDKLGVLVGVGAALAASIGNYYVMGEKISVLSQEVEILRFKEGYNDNHIKNETSDNKADIAALTTELSNLKMAAMVAYENMPDSSDLEDRITSLTIRVETSGIDRIREEVEELTQQFEERVVLVDEILESIEDHIDESN